MNGIALREISNCFQGVIPSIVATADANGMPNVTYVSQVYLVGVERVALSCQFFNKTRRNLEANPRAAVEVYDPLTLQAYRLRLKYLHSETAGALFETMKMRVEAIASVTGMKGVFRLIASDVFEVVSVERVDGFLTVPSEQNDRVTIDGLRTEVRGLQVVSERINRSETLDELLHGVLESIEAFFEFRHTMVLLADESGERLTTLASRGYGESGVGAEVTIGEGIIGTVARERRLLRMTGLEAGLRYGRAIRRETISGRAADCIPPEIALPGLQDAESALAIPLSVGDRLVGVLAAESRNAMRFHDWHEAYLEIIGNQIALGIDRMIERSAADGDATAATPVVVSSTMSKTSDRKRTIVYYANGDCVFVDDEYLVRSVPGRIFWKLLNEWQQSGRTAFTNRELRLDPALGLPAVRDNLESRLILLRHRLDEKDVDVRIVPTARGRFTLAVDARLELTTR